MLGGGCYGTFYTRQLLRAADAGAIADPEILIVDHNPNPRVASELATDKRFQVVRADWEPFFDEYLAQLEADTSDQIVPPPFTPHLAVSWLLRALRRGRPDVSWDTESFSLLPATPFARQAEGGPLTASHADWVCPVHCIEPDVCPKTRGPRDWDMADTARELAAEVTKAGQPVQQVHLLQCLHLTHGVGTYPAAALVAAYADLAGADIVDGPIRALVGTVSRCHGAMHLLKGQRGTDTVPPERTLSADRDTTSARMAKQE